MKLWGLRKIEKRILEIKQILGDEKRRRDMGNGVTTNMLELRLREANRPLLAELEELQIERQFIHDTRVLFISSASILVALIVAFGVPIWQKTLREHTDIQSLYQTIIANEDIFISNSNEIKYAEQNNLPFPIPELYIEFSNQEDIYKIIQRQFGIDSYRFFLYYLNQTQFLNQKIHYLKNIILERGQLNTKDEAISSYKSLMEDLGEGSWDKAKFNYIHDTSCILYFFQQAFPYIKIAEREKTINCSNDSLNRLFYQFGYVKAEVPKWLAPRLREALNEREAGLGNRLIKY